VQGDDAKASCRPYRVILLTDGADTCGGDPVAAAGALADAGIKVSVIGFATNNQTVINELNAIAAAGDTVAAIFVDDSDELSAAISSIIEDSIKVEICNNVDDDCDDAIDEGFGGFPKPSCNNGEVGICARSGQNRLRRPAGDHLQRAAVAIRCRPAAPPTRSATSSTTTATASSTRTPTAR
jgi:hypothetical protein